MLHASPASIAPARERLKVAATRARREGDVLAADALTRIAANRLGPDADAWADANDWVVWDVRCAACGEDEACADCRAYADATGNALMVLLDVSYGRERARR